MPAKQTYETPALTAVGSFEEITQAAGSGGHLDFTFQDGTPTNQLTFS